eukprot:63175_1
MNIHSPNTREPLRHVDQNNSYSLGFNKYPPQQQRRNKRKSVLKNKENKRSVQCPFDSTLSPVLRPSPSSSDSDNSLFRKLSNLVTKTNIQGDAYTHDHGQEDHDTFTPSTGNTPLINTKITPKIQNDNELEYSPEFITDLIGKDTLKEDYLNTLLNEEKRENALAWFNQNASFLKNRNNAVDWLCCIGEEFELNRRTIYLSVYYLDKLCSSNEVNVVQYLQMVAASCLLIAIKYNEREEKVPSLYKLSSVCNKQYTPSEFKPMELKILNLLSFELKVVLPIHFLEYYIDVASGGCVFDDDALGTHRDLHLNKQSNVYLNKFAIFFCDMLCQDYSFYQYLPSIVACAVLIAARRALKIEPYFNCKLMRLWSGDAIQIEECFRHLWNEYHSNFPQDAIKAEELQPRSLRDLLNDKVEGYHQRGSMDIDL